MAGDLLLSVRAPVGALNIADQAYGIGRGLCAIRPGNAFEPQFCYYVLSTVRTRLEAVATGSTYDAVTAAEVGDLTALLPPQFEQRTIAAFLDRETAKIDALVAKKKRLIELLREKRTALITHAVTKGLDPTVPLKDSGVEWLGKIPAHWEVKRLKHVAKEPLQYGASEASEFNDPEQPRFIRITDIDETGRLREDTFRSLPQEIARPYLLKRGDLLLARSGATVGKTFLYQESWGKACYAGYLIRFRTNNAVCTPEFVSYFTLSSAYWSWLSGTFIQATIQNVSAERYANLTVTLPPIEEQQEIMSFLDRETAKLDALIAKVREGIEKLKEYRIALISAAVTGKIDVREAV
ncbi:MAG: restriction endonuclease subunit S [Nitrospirota bacterium]